MKTDKQRQRLTDITINVGPLIVRLSYRDVMLIMTIVNKAVELSSQSPRSSIMTGTSTENAGSSSARDRSVVHLYEYNNAKTTPSDDRNLDADVMLTREMVGVGSVAMREVYAEKLDPEIVTPAIAARNIRRSSICADQ
jgi:hypothetical protein